MQHSHLLKPTQQATLLNTVIKYFIICHNNKIHEAVELFSLCYNLIDDSVKYTLAVELGRFLTTASQIGKKKFVDRLVEKSEWLRSVYQTTKEQHTSGITL